MADIIDDANDTAEFFLAGALRSALSAATIAPAAKGACLYCDTPLPPDRRWCDHECRDLWEAEQKGVA